MLAPMDTFRETPLAQSSHTRTFEPLALKVPDVCRITSLSKSEVYRQLLAGNIRCKKVGKATIIMLDSVKDFLAKLPPGVGG